MFNSEFYLATATVIPLLWLTAGLATNAIAAFVRLAAVANVLTAPFVPRVTRLLGVAFKVPVPPMIGLFVGAGLLGELLSLIALYSRDTATWLKVAVFASVVILLVFCATVLIVAILLSKQSSRVEEPPAGPAPDST